MFLRERFEIGHARHRSVFVHDLADDARGRETCEAREIDGAFGLSRAHEHAAFARLERKHVSGRDEIFRAAHRARDEARRVRAVRRADARRHAVTRFDAHGERGAERRPAASG